MLPQLEALTGEMAAIGEKYGASCSQVGIAWAIAKGTLPIIGATKERHVVEAAEAAKIQLTAEEVAAVGSTLWNKSPLPDPPRGGGE